MKTDCGLTLSFPGARARRETHSIAMNPGQHLHKEGQPGRQEDAAFLSRRTEKLPDMTEASPRLPEMLQAASAGVQAQEGIPA